MVVKILGWVLYPCLGSAPDKLGKRKFTEFIYNPMYKRENLDYISGKEFFKSGSI